MPEFSMKFPIRGRIKRTTSSVTGKGIIIAVCGIVTSPEWLGTYTSYLAITLTIDGGSAVEVLRVLGAEQSRGSGEQWGSGAGVCVPLFIRFNQGFTPSASSGGHPQATNWYVLYVEDL